MAAVLWDLGNNFTGANPDIAPGLLSWPCLLPTPGSFLAWDSLAFVGDV